MSETPIKTLRRGKVLEDRTLVDAVPAPRSGQHQHVQLPDEAGEQLPLVRSRGDGGVELVPSAPLFLGPVLEHEQEPEVVPGRRRVGDAVEPGSEYYTHWRVRLTCPRAAQVIATRSESPASWNSGSVGLRLKKSISRSESMNTRPPATRP
jgi:hypothetical protein